MTTHLSARSLSLVAAHGHDVIGYAAIVWESNYAGFRGRGIPLIHQVAVARPFRRQGVATLLMDAAEQLARDRGIATLVLPSACSMSMARLSSYTGGAAMYLMMRGYFVMSSRATRGRSGCCAQAIRLPIITVRDCKTRRHSTFSLCVPAASHGLRCACRQIQAVRFEPDSREMPEPVSGNSPNHS